MFTIKDNSIIFDYNFNDEFNLKLIEIIKNYKVLEFKNQHGFVGFYKDHSGQALSKQRIFSSSGESHGVSRSIGDRGAARAGFLST